jgi:hypothetical protein
MCGGYHQLTCRDSMPGRESAPNICEPMARTTRASKTDSNPTTSMADGTPGLTRMQRRARASADHSRLYSGRIRGGSARQRGRSGPPARGRPARLVARDLLRRARSEPKYEGVVDRRKGCSRGLLSWLRDVPAPSRRPERKDRVPTTSTVVLGTVPAIMHPSDPLMNRTPVS